MAALSQERGIEGHEWDFRLRCDAWKHGINFFSELDGEVCSQNFYSKKDKHQAMKAPVAKLQLKRYLVCIQVMTMLCH